MKSFCVVDKIHNSQLMGDFRYKKNLRKERLNRLQCSLDSFKKVDFLDNKSTMHYVLALKAECDQILNDLKPKVVKS